MIQIEKLKFSYPVGDFELSIPEFDITNGEKVAVIGPSGSGKTTLLNLISGIIELIEGTIQVGKTRVNELNDEGRRNFRITSIGFVFQDFELLDYLTIHDNILHPYRISSALTLDANVKKRAAGLADTMGISDKLKRMPNDLSHGEKQRAAICRALLPYPKVILADEATGNLDPVNKHIILDQLFSAVEEHNATLLAVTHDHELLRRFDRVIDFTDFRL